MTHRLGVDVGYGVVAAPDGQVDADAGAAGRAGRRPASTAAGLQHGTRPGADTGGVRGGNRPARAQAAGGAVSSLPGAGQVPPDAAGPGSRQDTAAGPGPGGHAAPGGHDGAGRDLTDPGSLAANYAIGGFGQALAWGARPALIIIDMVRAYFDPDAELYMGTTGCLESASRVLASAREAGIPVLHTRVEFDPDGLSGGVFIRKVPALRHFVPGSRLGQIMPQVAPAEHEVVIVKQYASAFYGTTLAATLTALRVDTLIIGGVSTSGCVRATGVDAMQHGYVPLVVRQAVGDRDPRPHEANLFDLQAKYAEVVDEDEVRAWLAGLGKAR